MQHRFSRRLTILRPSKKLTHMHLVRILLLAIFPFSLLGQPPIPTNGVADSKTGCYALKNATIIVSPEKTIEKGTLIIRDGKITDVGLLVIVPSDAVTIDCTGKTIVPAFIELFST